MFVNHVDSAKQRQPKWAGEGSGKDRLNGIHHQSELRARFVDSVGGVGHFTPTRGGREQEFRRDVMRHS